MSSKEIILDRLRSKKIVDKVNLDGLNLNNFIVNDGDLYENLKKNLENNKSEIYECDEENLKEQIDEILEKIGTKRVMFGTNLPINTDELKPEKLLYDKSVNEIYNELFNADTSIIEAKFGVANLGVLCFLSSKTQPRLLSLLPKHCIVLIKKDAIVESMDDAFKKVLSEGELPTNIIFIIGPSRTSDIELIAVLGVHGPQHLHVIFY